MMMLLHPAVVAHSITAQCTTLGGRCPTSPAGSGRHLPRSRCQGDAASGCGRIGTSKAHALFVAELEAHECASTTCVERRRRRSSSAEACGRCAQLEPPAAELEPILPFTSLVVEEEPASFVVRVKEARLAAAPCAGSRMGRRRPRPMM